MVLFKKSRFTVDLPVENQEDLVAIYHTMTNALMLISGEYLSRILTDSRTLADTETIELLYEQGLLVKNDTDENVVFENWKQQHVHDFSTLGSKVLVTRKCNNRCRYCILVPEAKEMSRETAQAMDKFYIDTIKEKNPRRVQDDYLGGEPLLNAGIILESAARRFYSCEGKGIEYGFTITTNGTLLKPSLIFKLKKVGLTGIRVSMAGPAAVHDHLRPSKYNGKTYDIITKNLQAVSGMIPIVVECQYDSRTLDYQRIPEMLDEFKDRNIAINEINFTPILDKRGKSPCDSGMDQPHITLFLMHEARKRGYMKERTAPSNACMVDFRSNLVIDTDGSIIPCPSLQGGEMAYGHVNKGINFIAESQLLKRILPDRCLSECELLPICMGGCRMQAFVSQGNFAGIDCHYDSYRFLLEDYISEKAAEALIHEEDIGL